MAQKLVSKSEWMRFCTTRIETTLSSGGKTTGTGFFFVISQEENLQTIVLITNKHVLDGAKSFSIFLTRKDENDMPMDSPPEKITISGFDSFLVRHPETDVDLCAFILGPTLQMWADKGRYYYYGLMGFETVPTLEELSDLAAVQDIVMVGYPNGIWDEHNNQPVIRKGVTSTDPALNWNNKPVFLIDAACFPGSSGSPVFLYNPLGTQSKSGSYQMGKGLFKFLGILYAGPQHTATGDIVEVPIAQSKLQARSNIPNNLGLVVSSQKLKELIPLVDKRGEEIVKARFQIISATFMERCRRGGQL
ncbi:S1 family peptidase, partial [Paraglaciecola chathamensis]